MFLPSGKLRRRADCHGSSLPLVKPFRVMKTNNFSVAEWNKWKNQVRDFYRTPLTPKSRDVASVFIQKPMDNRPYISVDILGKQIVGLLDSGANVSVVGEKGIELLKKT